jgi:O-antigen/teichoic acid export membrane protein
MVHLRRSLFITFFSTNAMTAVHFVITLILARLLTPAEVGIFSITSVVIGLAAVFRDFGVSTYIQSEKDLTPAKIRSALGLLLTTSWSLALCLYFGSETIAAYYGQPGIGSVMRVLTLSFVLMPFASFFYSMMARNLQAHKQAIVNVVGTIFYAATCITLAYKGYSYMSLAWANVANLSGSVICYWLLRPRGISLLPSLRGWKQPMSFGAGAILGNLVNHVYVSIPDLVLGKLGGPHNVGLYSRANGLVGIFEQVAGPTVRYNALPYISANHHAQVPLAPILTKATAYLTGFALPAYAVTAVFAKDIIRVLYGPTWVEAAPLVAVLCVCYGLKIGYALCAQALTAIGRPYLSAVYAGAGVLARGVMIWLLGARDAMTFALALLAADLITAPVPAWMMSRYLGYTMRQSFGAHIPSVMVAAACAGIALVMKLAMPADWPAALRVVLLGLAMVPAWLGLIVVLRHPLREEVPSLLGRFLPRAFTEGMSKKAA